MKNSPFHLSINIANLGCSYGQELRVHASSDFRCFLNAAIAERKNETLADDAEIFASFLERVAVEVRNYASREEYPPIGIAKKFEIDEHRDTVQAHLDCAKWEAALARESVRIAEKKFDYGDLPDYPEEDFDLGIKVRNSNLIVKVSHRLGDAERQAFIAKLEKIGFEKLKVAILTGVDIPLEPIAPAPKLNKKPFKIK